MFENSKKQNIFHTIRIFVSNGLNIMMENLTVFI